MQCQRFSDADAFLKVAEEFLDAHDPDTNLILSNAYRLRDTPPTTVQPAYMSIITQHDGTIIMTAIMGYRLPLSVYASGEVPEEALFTLVTDLLEWQRNVHNSQSAQEEQDTHRGAITKLVAPEEVAHSFARVWTETTNVQATPGMHMRLYELRTVFDPEYNNGHMRLAEEPDKPMIARWIYEMDQEAVGGGLSEADAERAAETIVGNRRAFIWEDGGEPVTMVCKTRPTKRGIVLNGVYTPPNYRRQGYATSCVAAVSQRLLDEGYEFCSLFTDLTNPTSNSIYMKVGYKPIRDYYEYWLKP